MRIATLKNMKCYIQTRLSPIPNEGMRNLIRNRQ